MAKAKDTELVVPTGGELVAPSFMSEVPSEGLGDMGKYQTTPRLTVVQGQSAPERKEQFGEGGVCIMPDAVKVADAGEDFIATPLLFWPTWELWSDINDAATPMVVETTTDENSVLARKSKNADTREEVYDDRNGYRRNYVECLNFLVMLEGEGLEDTVATLTFSKGEHYAGSKLCAFLKRRKVPIYGNRIAFKSAARSRNNRSWWGFDFNNPADGNAFVQSQDKFEQYQALHRELATMVAKLSVNREEEGTTSEPSPHEDGMPI